MTDTQQHSKPPQKYRGRRQTAVEQAAYSIPQAADYLGTSTRFVEMEIYRGNLCKILLSTRLVRVAKSELDRYLAERTVSR
jgi:excisionase family DNA binding protein